ncbi:MAG: hypothetical protein OYH77_07865 [Pseudomonadota bacterium]|nr:hypothetical protein [Pseudomonadota bacterium]
MQLLLHVPSPSSVHAPHVMQVGVGVGVELDTSTAEQLDDEEELDVASGHFFITLSAWVNTPPIFTCHSSLAMQLG